MYLDLQNTEKMVLRRSTFGTEGYCFGYCGGPGSTAACLLGDVDEEELLSAAALEAEV